MNMIELEAGPARVHIDVEHGARIALLEIDGLALLLPERDDPLRWGCYPMAPWAGRVRHGRFSFEGRSHALPLRMPPHAIHGTVLDRPWHDRGAGVLEIDLGPDWPWPGRAVQRFRLDADGLDVRLEVHAERDPFPASAGLHPWFARRLARGGPLTLDFAPRAMYVRDAEHIPTGERVPPPAGPWDDCFTDPAAPPRLRWPGALSLALVSPTDHWVVYDEPAEAICVEPMTGPPDALNIAPRVVEPGHPLVLETRFAWTLE